MIKKPTPESYGTRSRRSSRMPMLSLRPAVPAITAGHAPACELASAQAALWLQVAQLADDLAIRPYSPLLSRSPFALYRRLQAAWLPSSVATSPLMADNHACSSAGRQPRIGRSADRQLRCAAGAKVLVKSLETLHTPYGKGILGR